MLDTQHAFTNSNGKIPIKKQKSWFFIEEEYDRYYGMHTDLPWKINKTVSK